MSSTSRSARSSDTNSALWGMLRRGVFKRRLFPILTSSLFASDAKPALIGSLD